MYIDEHLVDGKSYIGSSANLERRLRNYYTISYLESNTKKLEVIFIVP